MRESPGKRKEFLKEREEGLGGPPPDEMGRGNGRTKGGRGAGVEQAP